MSLRPCLDCGRPSEGPRCHAHSRAKDRSRGTTTQRDYGAEHQAERAAWTPAVAAGQVDCRRGALCIAPQLRIRPGERWHLGHPDAECPAPTAPEHAGCNIDAANRLR